MSLKTCRCFVIATLCTVGILCLNYNILYYSIYNTIQPNQFPIMEPKLKNDTLIDLHNFEYLINNASICLTPTAWKNSVIIVVHSSRHQFNHRYAIRNTWGSVKEYKGWQFHLIFLLGIDPASDIEFEHRLWEESQLHGDLIVGNFIDTYVNLTYKHLMGYKWVSTFCPSAKFILKADDDIYVNLFHLAEVLLNELSHSQKTYGCVDMKGNKPVRDKVSRWYVNEELYPDAEYPPFCSGSAYLLKTADAAKIYSVCNKTKFFWIDDVFVTGILREKYVLLADNNDTNSLEICYWNQHYHLGNKKEIIRWCRNSPGLVQLKYTFIVLTKNDVVGDMFCIWNKVRLLKFAINNAMSEEIKYRNVD